MAQQLKTHIQQFENKCNPLEKDSDEEILGKSPSRNAEMTSATATASPEMNAINDSEMLDISLLESTENIDMKEMIVQILKISKSNNSLLKQHVKEINFLKKENEHLQKENANLKKQIASLKEPKSVNFLEEPSTSNVPSWAQIVQEGFDQKKSLSVRDTSSEEDFRMVSPRKKKPKTQRNFEPKKLVESLFNPTRKEKSNPIKRVRSSESLTNETGIVLERGTTIEKNATLAIIGDSQVKLLLTNKHWQSYLYQKQCIVRCFPGDTVNRQLQTRSCLPATNNVQDIIISFGGNDLARLNDMESGVLDHLIRKKDLLHETLHEFASKLISLAERYTNANRQVVVLLPGYRKDVHEKVINVHNEICKEMLKQRNIKYIDIAVGMKSKRDYVSQCLVNDQIHFRAIFFNEVMEKAMALVNVDLSLPSEQPTISYRKTYANVQMCMKCGGRDHTHCKSPFTLKNTCKLCMHVGHMPAACNSHFHKCNHCGEYGHYRECCPNRKHHS